LIPFCSRFDSRSIPDFDLIYRQGRLFQQPARCSSLIIPKVLTLTALADVRMLLEMCLPPEHRERSTWLHVKSPLHGAARSQDEPGDVESVSRMVLSMEGVECQANAARLT